MFTLSGDLIAVCNLILRTVATLPHNELKVFPSSLSHCSFAHLIKIGPELRQTSIGSQHPFNLGAALKRWGAWPCFPWWHWALSFASFYVCCALAFSELKQATWSSCPGEKPWNETCELVALVRSQCMQVFTHLLTYFDSWGSCT